MYSISKEDRTRPGYARLSRTTLAHLLFLAHSQCAELHNAVTILSLLVWLVVLLLLDALIELTHVQVIRVFCCQVAHHVTPLQACESRLALRLVSEHEPRVCVFAVLQVLLEHVVLLNRHLFVADRAHVVIIAVVDVCFVLVVEAGLEGLPGGLRRVFRRNILGAFGLVKDAGGALDSKMLTKRVEPLEY